MLINLFFYFYVIFYDIFMTNIVRKVKIDAKIGDLEDKPGEDSDSSIEIQGRYRLQFIIFFLSVKSENMLVF